MDSSKHYFGLKENFECDDIGATYDSNQNKDYRCIILQTEVDKSKSGANIYYGYKILDPNTLNDTTVNLGNGVQITDITREYWWSLGSFDENKVECFYKGGIPPERIDNSFMLFTNLIEYNINRKISHGKFCYIRVSEDSGYTKGILTSCESSEYVSTSFKILSILSDLKKIVTFKLYITIGQLNNMNVYSAEEKKRLSDIFYNKIDVWYKESLKYNKAVHNQYPFLKEGYEKIKSMIK